MTSIVIPAEAGIQYSHDVFSLPSGFPIRSGMTSVVIPADGVIPVKTGIQSSYDIFSLPSGFPVKLGMTNLEAGNDKPFLEAGNDKPVLRTR